jgi:hypothetical protein
LPPGEGTFTYRHRRPHRPSSPASRRCLVPNPHPRRPQPLIPSRCPPSLFPVHSRVVHHHRQDHRAAQRSYGRAAAARYSSHRNPRLPLRRPHSAPPWVVQGLPVIKQELRCSVSKLSSAHRPRCRTRPGRRSRTRSRSRWHRWPHPSLPPPPVVRAADPSRAAAISFLHTGRSPSSTQPSLTTLRLLSRPALASRNDQRSGFLPLEFHPMNLSPRYLLPAPPPSRRF